MSVAVAPLEGPAVREVTFLERIDLWRDRSLLTGTTRIFEVPIGFRLPCTAPGQASLKAGSCAG